MIHFVHTVADLLARGHDLVLATICAHSGSTPRDAGARMAVLRDGSIRGTVGGGVVEAAAVRAALNLFDAAPGATRFLDMDLTGEQAASTSMICGGRLRLFLERLDAACPPGPGEAPGPNEVSGPGEVPGPAEVPGPGEVPGPAEASGPDSAAKPGTATLPAPSRASAAAHAWAALDAVLSAGRGAALLTMLESDADAAAPRAARHGLALLAGPNVDSALAGGTAPDEGIASIADHAAIQWFPAHEDAHGQAGSGPFRPGAALRAALARALPRAASDGAPALEEADGTPLLLASPFPAAPVLYLFGAGHVSQATAAVAAGVGFSVVVLDDRAEFANRERFPHATRVQVLQSLDTALAELGDGAPGAPAGPAGDDAYLAILTRGHLHDKTVLAQALRTPARYVGMIGSRKKRDAIYDALRAEGYTEADIARCRCPIGLTIGAQTPEEIAVSIVAELIAARAGALR
jgi:xanthine/CO dehydrogenase XdhC/CoxF family maturation factor